MHALALLCTLSGPARAQQPPVDPAPPLGDLPVAAPPVAAPLPPPPDRRQTWAKVRLIGHEAAFGGFVLGAGVGFTELSDDGGPVFAAALLGGAAGTAGGVLLARRDDYHPAMNHALIAPQQLFTFTGGALGGLSGESEPVGLGILGGAALGTGAGLLWALHEPDPAQALATHSGAFWGLGLTVVGLSYTYAWDELDSERAPLVLAAGADAGALLGLGLAAALPLTEDQLRFANAGGVIGAGGAFLFASTTANLIWYSPHSVAAIVGGAGVVGGALGVVLATRFEDAPVVPLSGSALGVDGGRLRLSVPVPRAIAVPGARDEVGWGLYLVDQGF